MFGHFITFAAKFHVEHLNTAEYWAVNVFCVFIFHLKLILLFSAIQQQNEILTCSGRCLRCSRFCSYSLVLRLRRFFWQTGPQMQFST
jgi:hypothetical protein